ncbi:helix-turn-helix domain-containing protein [Porphyromonas gingivalis]|uniref:Transcriptional regulator, putative n=1 Tax=Porphyromonas gingivalis (strain ATCC BAA-308 / W83) TaxID=242619 RepID=Q7MWQ3_PORGI|nr:helix-turn-helix transcriptional regulator [Porphyromonas gingivalis]AAQ65735.1 transcriptional regulator, putative [Porphyromonas gingivalis W83]AKV64593.1 putative transcriptional regulator [Porphyromonas gingivalis]ATS01696.1 XRE family transcriptional regulator [Porphyromonas gingivalis]ETA26260.1 transcriptional regulator [Porphyromonas gingivalis SJD2]MCE8190436.1 helix-turn-helix transcriptional regulator [Porphyromonas gingivalis]
MNRLREALKERGITQTELSTRLGKSFNMVNLYVANKHQPSIPTLFQIAEILDMDVRDLLVSNKQQNK